MTKILAYFALSFMILGLDCDHFSTSNSIASNRGSEKVLEIYSEAPTNYPSQRYLLLRIYSDRSAELDTYPTKPIFPVPFELKRSYIDETQLKTITELLEKLRTNKIYNYGPTLPMGLDSQITVSLIYDIGDGSKEIVIKENDSHIHIDTISPASLAKLLKLCYEIRSEKIKEFQEP